MVAGATLTLAGKREEARLALNDALRWAYASGAELASELEYYDFVWHFLGGDYVSAKAALQRGLDVDRAHGQVEGYIVTLQSIRSRHLSGLAAIESVAENYFEAASLLRDGLEEFSLSEAPDAGTEASLIANFATLVRDLDLEDEEYVRERLRSLRRTAYLMPNVFHILRSLGWCRALRGDHLGAFRDLREAGAAAVSPSLQLIAAIDRAILAQGLSQQLTARDELERCQDLAARIDWERVSGDERIALLFLAQTLAPVRARAGRAMLERYQWIRAKLSPRSFAGIDRRLRADERYTEGVVAKAEANDAVAVRAFLDAFEIWEAIGYRWRAALAAIELAVLTKDSRYAGYAAAEAVKRPGSWLAERLRTVNEGAS